MQKYKLKTSYIIAYKYQNSINNKKISCINYNKTIGKINLEDEEELCNKSINALKWLNELN